MKTAIDIIDTLLHADTPSTARALIEASVRRPPRGSVYVATYTGPEGGQVRRSTGLRDREQALELARRWEAEARAERLSRMSALKGGKPGAERKERHPGGLTQKEIAELMNMSERAVRETERRAFQKLRKHPALRDFWREFTGGEVEEDISGTEKVEELTFGDLAVLWSMARTAGERIALKKALDVVGIEIT